MYFEPLNPQNDVTQLYYDAVCLKMAIQNCRHLMKIIILSVSIHLEKLCFVLLVYFEFQSTSKDTIHVRNDG